MNPLMEDSPSFGEAMVRTRKVLWPNVMTHWPTKSFAVCARPAGVNMKRRIGRIKIQYLEKGSFDMGRLYASLLAANHPTIQGLALHSSRPN
jgi:hypothetical protein